MKLKVKKRFLFPGLIILILLAASYFVEISMLDEFGNTIITPLLGILIFYNPFVLGLYGLIIVVLLVKGVKIIMKKK